MRKLFYLFLLCLPITLKAQHKISGYIKDIDANPIEGASVKVTGSKDFSTSSDKNGYYAITNLTNRSYILTISHISFVTVKEEIFITNNVHIDIMLKQASYPAEEIVITAIRGEKNTPISQTTINNDKLNENNLGQDITFLLNNTPSLVTTSDAGGGIGYSGIRIRGTNSSRINVTINGVPLNDAESQEVFWVDLPDLSSSVDNIQIQRGIGTSTNGTSAFGASINIKTNELSKHPFFRAAISTGSYSTIKQTYNAGTGLINDRFGVDIRLSRIESDGYINRANSNLESYFISTGYNLPKSLLKLMVFSGKEKTFQAWDGVPSTHLASDRKYNAQGMYKDSIGNINYYDNQTDNYDQTHWHLMYASKISSHLDVNLLLHYTLGKGYYESYRDDKKYTDYNILYPTHNDKTDIIDQRWLDNDFWGGIFSLNMKYPKLHTIVGGSWNKYLGGHFGKIIWSEFGNIPINYEWYRNKGIKTDFMLYTKLNFLLSEKVNLFIDLQYKTVDYKINGIDNDQRDISQNHNFNFFNPKFGIRYQVNKNQHGYLNFAIAHREPSRNNFVDANLALPHPQSEQLFNVEVGYSLGSKKSQFATNFYYMNYKDQLVLTGEINDVGSAVMTNVKNSYRLGLELMGEINFSEKIGWQFNTTLSRNKINDITVYIDDWNSGTQRIENYKKSNLSFSPNIIANSIFNWKIFKEFNLNLASQYVGKQYVDNTKNEDRKLKSYFVNNLNLSYNLNLFKNCKIKLLINNLFNEKYESNAWVYRYYSDDKEYKLDGYFPQAERHFLLGVDLEI